MTFALARFVVATAIAVTSLAHAGEPVQLNKEETQKALAGKSITYEARGGGADTGYAMKTGRGEIVPVDKME